MAFATKSFDDLLVDLSTALSVEGSTINDMNEGSKLYGLGRGFMRVVSDAYREFNLALLDSDPATSTGESLDLFVNAFGMSRNYGTPAYGSLLALPKAGSSTGVVNVGDIFFTDAGTFVATATTVLGSPYSVIPIAAVTVGKLLELPAGTEMTPNDSSIVGDFSFQVGSAINALGQPTGGLYGAEDEETDADVRLRFADYIQSLTKATYKAVYQALASLAAIKSFNLVEFMPMPGFLSVFLDDGSDSALVSASLKSQIDDLLLDWRAAGVGLIIKMLDKVLVDIEIEVQVSKDCVPSAVETNLTNIIRSDTETYGQGQTFYTGKLNALAFQDSNVLNVRVVKPVDLVIPVLKQQVFRARSVKVNAST